MENFKYLGTIIFNEGSDPEIFSMIAQTTAALCRRKITWRKENISLASTVILTRTFISILIYAYESLTSLQGQRKEQEGEDDRRRDEKQHKNGQEWGLDSQNISNDQDLIQ